MFLKTIFEARRLRSRRGFCGVIKNTVSFESVQHASISCFSKETSLRSMIVRNASKSDDCYCGNIYCL